MVEDNGIFEDFCGKICDDTVVPSIAPDAPIGDTTIPSTADTATEGVVTGTHTEQFHSPHSITSSIIRIHKIPRSYP